MSLGLHFTPPQTLRQEEQCSQGHRVRGGGDSSSGLFCLKSGLLPSFTTSRLSPFVELNQSFITFKLLDTNILTAFRGPGPWKSHFCWSRASRDQHLSHFFHQWDWRQPMAKWYPTHGWVVPFSHPSPRTWPLSHIPKFQQCHIVNV